MKDKLINILKETFVQRVQSSLKYTIAVFSIICLCACEPENSPKSKHISIPDLSVINIEYWDNPSKQIIQKFIETPHEQLSNSQKQHIAEVLITHENLEPAVNILKQMNVSQSQYLTYLLVTAYYKQGLLQQALASIKDMRLPDIDSAVLSLQYKILLEMSQSQQLIKLMESENKQNINNNPLSKYYLAMAYLQEKQCQKAIALFKQVIKKNPSANKIYVPMTSAYQQCGNQNMANKTRKKQGSVPLSNVDEFQDKLLKNGDPVGFYNQSLNLALKYNKTNEIILAAESLLKLGETDIDLLHNYAIALYRSNKLDSANKALINATLLDKNNVKSYQLLFEFNRRTKVEIARKAINKLIEINPNNALYQQALDYLNKSHP